MLLVVLLLQRGCVSFELKCSDLLSSSHVGFFKTIMEEIQVESKIGESSKLANSNISEIGNRELRQKQYAKLKREKKKDKKKRSQERQKHAEALGPDNAPAKLVPKTIESMREADETTVIADEDQQDEEVGILPMMNSKTTLTKVTNRKS